MPRSSARRAAAAAPTRCCGASCRASTPAAGIRRSTRARWCRRSPRSRAGRARTASPATSRSSPRRAASARPALRWRSMPRRCGATPRCRRCCRRSPRNRWSAARDAVPGLPRALLLDELPRDWLDRLRALECVALDANHEALTARDRRRRAPPRLSRVLLHAERSGARARARAVGRGHHHHRRRRPDPSRRARQVGMGIALRGRQALSRT